MFSLENMVISGDLNMALHYFKNWGIVIPSDPLEEYFLDLFKKYHLVDIAPPKISPTWKSKQGGVGVNKRLDCFLMKELVVDIYTRHKY